MGPPPLPQHEPFAARATQCKPHQAQAARRRDVTHKRITHQPFVSPRPAARFCHRRDSPLTDSDPAGERKRAKAVGENHSLQSLTIRYQPPAIA